MDTTPSSVFKAYDSTNAVAKKEIDEFYSAIEHKLISLARRELCFKSQSFNFRKLRTEHVNNI